MIEYRYESDRPGVIRRFLLCNRSDMLCNAAQHLHHHPDAGLTLHAFWHLEFGCSR